MNKRTRHPRTCPRCQRRLAWQGRLRICTRCLLIWRGDTFEPLTQDTLGGTSMYDYFYRT